MRFLGAFPNKFNFAAANQVASTFGGILRFGYLMEKTSINPWIVVPSKWDLSSPSINPGAKLIRLARYSICGFFDSSESKNSCAIQETWGSSAWAEARVVTDAETSSLRFLFDGDIIFLLAF